MRYVAKRAQSNRPMTRYALYFAPNADSPWWHAGCHWLGRDPSSDTHPSQNLISGMKPNYLADLTQNARRYGFHATLKAPFSLAQGVNEDDLVQHVAQFCQQAVALNIVTPSVQKLGDFLALQTTTDHSEIAVLAQDCVVYFAPLRAPMADADWQKRRQQNLTARQEELLKRWAYPYTEEQYRFHMTLTDSLAHIDDSTALILQQAAEACFAIDVPLSIDHLCIFKEEYPGAAFSLLHRCYFRGRVQAVSPVNIDD